LLLNGEKKEKKKSELKSKKKREKWMRLLRPSSKYNPNTWSRHPGHIRLSLSRSRYKQWRHFHALAVCASEVGPTEAGRHFKVSRQVAAYWRDRLSNSREFGTPFAPGSGGVRYDKREREWHIDLLTNDNNRVQKFKYDLLSRTKIRICLWKACRANPRLKIGEYRLILSRLGWEVSDDYIRAIFRRWRWSWKKPCRSQVSSQEEEEEEEKKKKKRHLKKLTRS